MTSPDAPVTVVERSQLSPVDDSLAQACPIPTSRMFEIKKALSVFRAADPTGEMFDASQGDGGASLPGVPVEILERAFAMHRDHGTGYDQPFGTPAWRKCVAEDYWKLDAATGWGPGNVVATQGGRDALLKAYEAMQALGHQRRGDFVITSRVPWVSYNWGPYAVGANVMLAPGREDDAWALTPEGIRACVDFARSTGDRRIAGLIVTSPDNPTGRTTPLSEQVTLAHAAFEAGIPFVLFDWIYHYVTDEEPHDLNEFLSHFSPAERDRIMVLDGITKSLGASNIRAAHLVASKEVCSFISSRASHGVIPSFYSLAVAMVAYQQGFAKAAASISGPTNASRTVLSGFLGKHDIRHILGKGYYAFMDLGPWIRAAGMTDSADMGTLLAEKFGLAVVPGVHFSPFAANWIRFSYALPPDHTRRAADRLWAGLSSVGR